MALLLGPVVIVVVSDSNLSRIAIGASREQKCLRRRLASLADNVCSCLPGGEYGDFEGHGVTYGAAGCVRALACTGLLQVVMFLEGYSR